MKWAGFRSFTAAVTLAAALTGCATGGSAPAADTGFSTPAPRDSGVVREYTVQPGDTLTIKFYYHPDHDQEVVVRPDGKIVLALVGEVDVAGRSTKDLGAELEKRYAQNLREPRIAVAMKSTPETRVWVGGEVTKPGFVPYRAGLTAVQAVLEAGGPKETAKVETVVLLQKVNLEQYKASKIDLARVLESGDTTADIQLGPSDVLFVPKTTIARLNQWVDQYLIKMIPVRPGIGLGGLF